MKNWDRYDWIAACIGLAGGALATLVIGVAVYFSY